MTINAASNVTTSVKQIRLSVSRSTRNRSTESSAKPLSESTLEYEHPYRLVATLSSSKGSLRSALYAGHDRELFPFLVVIMLTSTSEAILLHTNAIWLPFPIIAFQLFGHSVSRMRIISKWTSDPSRYDLQQSRRPHRRLGWLYHYICRSLCDVPAGRALFGFRTSADRIDHFVGRLPERLQFGWRRVLRELR